MNQIEDLFFSQIERALLALPERDFAFYPPRQWSGQFVWSKPKFIVEIEPHTSCGCGSICDGRERLAMAALLGYRVMRFTPEEIENEMALSFIKAMLEEGV